MNDVVHIINGTTLTDDYVSTIIPAIRSSFNRPVVIDATPTIDISLSYDSSRSQYHSSALLAQLLPFANGDKSSKWILLVDVDLFIPVLTFVFGEAQLDGSASIVSTHRLRNEYYGMPANDKLLRDRMEKEVVHELGHTFGLYHCHQFECVMRSSTYVEEIDLKRSYPCSSCQHILQSGLKTHPEQFRVKKDFA